MILVEIVVKRSEIILPTAEAIVQSCHWASPFSQAHEMEMQTGRSFMTSEVVVANDRPRLTDLTEPSNQHTWHPHDSHKIAGLHMVRGLPIHDADRSIASTASLASDQIVLRGVVLGKIDGR